MWLLLALIIGILLGQRLNELFLLSIRNGRTLIVRGRIPPSLLDAFADIGRAARIERATVQAIRGLSHARLVIRGVDDGTAQRFRNVFGIHPIRELRRAPRPSDRNLGQLIGWAWLAWLLLRR
jgi:hypothetical protein